jgi:DNA-binding NtrC family response regulator
MSTGRVLVIDDEREIIYFLSEVLKLRFDVLTAQSTAEADAILAEHSDIEVVVCDQQLPGELGLDFFARIRKTFPLIQRILLTGYTDQEYFLDAINRGEVYRYMVKPVKSRELLETVGQACDRFHEEAEANLKLTEHEQMEEQIKAVPTMVRNMRKSTRDMWTFLELSSGAIIAFVTLLITVTSVTLLGLYFMKESLGIDIFKDVHFFDML